MSSGPSISRGEKVSFTSDWARVFLKNCRHQNACEQYGCGRSGVRFPGQSNQTQSRQLLDTAATFRKSCAAQALNRGEGPVTCYTVQRNTASSMRI